MISDVNLRKPKILLDTGRNITVLQSTFSSNKWKKIDEKLLSFSHRENHGA